ncbi:polyketide synthase, partial [Rhizobiaceae sp. 2RAB30]
LMDPQHRLFLKASWEAIWDAGYDPGGFAGRSIGVFAGVQFQDYQKLLDTDGLQSAQACTGNAHAMLANRVSFILDIHGPSEAIDTACSSSLVAIHNAVRAIRLGECELAIAGGVNLLLTPDLFIMGRQLGVLSPSGQCRTFDAGADGYVRAEGVGALLLKPLSNAIRDRDHIYAVIKGTAVNHGGKAASLTAPNSRAQADLMVRAFRDAGLTPNDISYVEMHGTGTELGDPIEVEGIKGAFRKLRAEHALAPSPCAIGSVKTNIGHLEPAAGVAGVINVVMAMMHRTLPGLSNFRDLNPHIQLDEGFVIQAETAAWPGAQALKPLGALVNS